MAPAAPHPRTDALLDEADGLEVIVTDSVVEALALENNLIKQRMPRYNIRLRDDKNYPYLQLTTTEPFPRIVLTRSVEPDGNLYAGPFMPASLARRTMSLAHRLFGIRSCNEVIDGRRPRPCLEYDIKRCLAPCVESLCGAGQYSLAVEDARLLLEAKTDVLAGQLTERMVEAAANQRYEQAAQLRDAAKTVQTLRDRQQKMATVELGDRDVVGIRTGPAGAAVQVFQVRRGRVIERADLMAEAEAGRDPGAPDAEVLQSVLQQFYDGREVPPEIHIPVELPEMDATEAWLSERAGRTVRLAVPKRGDKRALLDLAARNAAMVYEARFNEERVAHHEALETLREVLELPAFPRRIECFDISTIQGSETVASLVVCEDGRMRRGEYRKFRIRNRESGFRIQGRPACDGDEACRAEARPRGGASEGGRFLDDFAAMNQVVMRRYQRVLEHGGPFPDLVVVDGGKGQLSAAYAALEELGLANLVAVGLAKKEELVFTRASDAPIALPRGSEALRLLQLIRDEAHRFAVTFHRQARRARDLRSDLDAIPGVGPRRRRALLTAFGSVAGVRRASREDLTAVVGPKVADAVLAHFAAGGGAS